MENNFGETIRTIRLKKKLSQEQFADQLGISPSSLSVYERGARDPSLSAAQKIAEKLGMSIDEMAGGKKPLQIKTYGEAIFAIAELIERFKAISIYDKDKEMTFIAFDDRLFETYLQNILKMLKLSEENTIHYGLYKLWLEREALSLENIEAPNHFMYGKVAENEKAEAEERRKIVTAGAKSPK